jgi:hypothetical protein
MQQPPTGSASEGSTPQNDTQTGGTTQELTSDAKQLGSKAADRIHSEVDNRKGQAVSQAQSLTSAIRQTADGLDDNAPQWLRSAFQQGADQLQRFAESIENKDSRQILNDVQSFARERPALFLGAAAAAGFAAARILKAGSEQQSSQQFTSEYDRSQPWGDGELGSENQDWGRGDTFGQQFDESSTGSQSSTLGGIGGGSSQAFIARPETQSPTSSQFEQSRMEDDPLVLGTSETPATPDGGLR